MVFEVLIIFLRFIESDISLNLLQLRIHDLIASMELKNHKCAKKDALFQINGILDEFTDNKLKMKEIPCK